MVPFTLTVHLTSYPTFTTLHYIYDISHNMELFAETM